MTQYPMQAVVDELAQLIDKARAQPGLSGLPTGLPTLDSKLGGLQEREMVVLGARPGQGKTALAWLWATTVAEHAIDFGLDGQVVFVTGEMSKTELAMREVSRRTDITITQQRNGYITESERSRIQGALEQISQLPMVIFDNSGIDIKQISSWLPRVPGGPLLVVIDYLQLVRGNPGQSRYQAVTEAINQLRLLRDAYACPLVVLSQLSRPDKEQQNERPNMDRLRDAGAVEEAANIVMLLHNPAAVPWIDSKDSKTELLVAKNRNGWTGLVPLEFRPEEITFRDLGAVAHSGSAA